jgi:hypothetical protein
MGMRITGAVTESASAPLAVQELEPVGSSSTASPPRGRRRTASSRATARSSTPIPWEQERFPVDRGSPTYDFENVNEAAHDAETGVVGRPVPLVRRAGARRKEHA